MAIAITTTTATTTKDRNTKKLYNTNIYIQKSDERPPCHVIINGKHAIYFLFLKHFLDIPFVKTVRCIRFQSIYPVQLFPP